MLKDSAKIQHSYIVGSTGSGKSFIGKRLAREIRMSGFPVFVASAKARRKNADGSEKSDVKEWRTFAGADFVTGDPMQIVKMWDANRLPPCCIVFDEGAVDLGNNPDKLVMDMFQLCRDDHIKIILLSQNYKRTCKAIRDNCADLRLFGCGSDDMKAARGDYAFNAASEQTIERVCMLNQYEYLHVNKAVQICEVIGRDGKALK
ncbi:ATP-binding protein [Coraliomargarita parva]|uniref:ATP-binding protein n=1 Tax=Coraliomargarita parva TaxID=3014050 RepID=UPI0022B39B18|nr:ATP-binding protein [Coraliomargarita parva]